LLQAFSLLQGPAPSLIHCRRELSGVLREIHDNSLALKYWRTAMEKSKIAESIIIRVGGGIREVSREPLETHNAIEPAPNEHKAEKSGATKTNHSDFEPPTRPS